MKINHCLRCDKDWCFRGVGRATRCGKCKSPYWDRKAVHDEKVTFTSNPPNVERKDKRVAVPGVRTGNDQQPAASRFGEDVRPHPEARSVLRVHDPKTCRVYKCGQCAAAKEK